MIYRFHLLCPSGPGNGTDPPPGDEDSMEVSESVWAMWWGNVKKLRETYEESPYNEEKDGPLPGPKDYELVENGVSINETPSYMKNEVTLTQMFKGNSIGTNAPPYIDESLPYSGFRTDSGDMLVYFDYPFGFIIANDKFYLSLYFTDEFTTTLTSSRFKRVKKWMALDPLFEPILDANGDPDPPNQVAPEVEITSTWTLDITGTFF